MATPGQALAGLAGAACIAFATFAVPSGRDQLAPVLFVIGAVLLGIVFGLPVASMATTGHPIGHIAAALADRERVLGERIRRHLGVTLLDVTEDIVLDPARAAHLVDRAIEVTAARWRGPIGTDVDQFLLCSVVTYALHDSRSDPVVDGADGRARLAALTRRDRAVEALRRHGQSDDAIAAVLDLAASELPPPARAPS